MYFDIVFNALGLWWFLKGYLTILGPFLKNLSCCQIPQSNTALTDATTYVLLLDLSFLLRSKVIGDVEGTANLLSALTLDHIGDTLTSNIKERLDIEIIGSLFIKEQSISRVLIAQKKPPWCLPRWYQIGSLGQLPCTFGPILQYQCCVFLGHLEWQGLRDDECTIQWPASQQSTMSLQRPCHHTINRDLTLPKTLEVTLGRGMGASESPMSMEWTALINGMAFVVAKKFF